LFDTIGIYSRMLSHWRQVKDVFITSKHYLLYDFNSLLNRQRG
jgi:hypothetical protein